MTWSAHNSRESEPVSRIRSVLSGRSYGDEMPVNSWTSPARSLIKPLGVPTLTDLDRATGIDIDEVLFSHQLAHTLVVLAE